VSMHITNDLVYACRRILLRYMCGYIHQHYRRTTRLLNMSKASTTLRHRSQFYFAIVVTIFITMLSEPDVTEKCIC
jgi:hypothetical protein